MSTPRPERAAVLERIEQALRQRLADSPGSEDFTLSGGGVDMAGLQKPGSYEEHVEGLLTRAEQRSREAETLSEEIAAALAAWRDRALQLRQRLAEWPTRAL
jgi:hypothetical protein